MSTELFTQKLLGVSITDESSEKILEYLTKSLQERGRKTFIVTPNPEIVVHAHHHTEFKLRLNSAEIALADGIGVVLAGKWLGRPLTHRITGVDFMKMICERVSKMNKDDTKRTVTVGFLGGRDGVAEAAAECLQKTYPNLQISYIGKEWNEQKIKDQKSKIKDSHIDILFVAFGFPKQENWIYENLPHIPVTVAMGVGGAFDYISGRVGRAPKLVRDLGFEWLWRLIRQPWRIKRQASLLEFMWLVLKEKFRRH